MSAFSDGISNLENLERRALDERSQLHLRATEMRSKVGRLRENLDVHRNARRYFGPAAGIVAGLGLLMGYALAGFFTNH